MVVHNAYVNDACGSSSDHKSDEEAKEPNVSIEKQAEIEKAAQKEEEKRKKSHEMFITNSFKSICKKFKKKRQGKRAFPYTRCKRKRDLRRLSLYNELNKKQISTSLAYLSHQVYYNPFEQWFFAGLKEELTDSRHVKYTVKDNLSKECPLKYYLEFGIVG